MMMGQGSYGYGGSSNLSALAPPFTVDRSVPKLGSNPLVDLNEPTYTVTFNPSLHNWVGAHPPNSRPDYFSVSNPEFDSVASSNAFRYSSSTAHVPTLNPPPNDAILYGQSSTNLLEVNPYYPSYVSSAIGSSDGHGPPGIHHHSGYDLLSTSHVATPNGSSNGDYTQNLSGLEHVAQWSGLWEGLADWQQSEHVQLDGSLCSNENFMNQGLYATESLSKYEEASHSIDTLGGKNHTDSAGIGQLDYKFFLGENPQLMPADYPTTSSSTSTLLFPETCPTQVPILKAVSSWKQEMPYSASYEKFFKKNDASPSDTATVMNTSPDVAIRPPDTSSSRNMNHSNDEKNEDFGSNNPSVVKEPHPSICSEVLFDASQVSFHLGQNDQIVAEFSSGKNQEPPRCGSGSVLVDVLDHFAKEKCVNSLPHRSQDGLNLVIDKNDAINSVTSYTENIDNYNPPVDSPCWKGAPVSHFSQFEVSEAITSQNMKKLETSSGSNHQAHQIYALSSNDGVKASPEKLSENSIQHDGRNLEDKLFASWKRSLAVNVLPREGIDDALRSGPCHAKTSFHAVQISDDAVSNKLIDNSDHKPPYNEQQSCEGGKWMWEKNCTSGIGVADVEINMNDDAVDCSSHVPFHAIEHVLRSPPSTDDASTKLTKSHGGESTEKMYVRTLIDTMQNLSELLVFHFSTDASQLKEDDYDVLKEVINNLDLCMLKNVERVTSTQEPVFPQRNASQLLGKSVNPWKVTNMNASQVSRIDIPNSQAPFKCQHAQEDEYNTISGKDDEKSSNYVSVRAAADVLKGDNMTQAVRKALTENFHGEEEKDPQVILYKNLWLEAEASLCSVNCTARFNRMKREMEKCNSQKVTGLPENTVVMEKVSGSKVSTDAGTNKMLESDTKGSPLTDDSIPGSSILSTSRLADDVAARFQVLKCQRHSSSTSNISGTSGVDKTLGSPELSSSETSPNPVHVDKLACDEKVGQKPEISIQDSPKSSKTSQVDDVEASMMARFQILKCRVDNLNSVEREEHQKATDDLGYAGLQRHCPIGDDGSEAKILDVNMESESQNHAFNSAEDVLSVKEFRLFVKDDLMTQSCMTNRPGDQSHAGIHGGSSDWEHVLLEELAGQNC